MEILSRDAKPRADWWSVKPELYYFRLSGCENVKIAFVTYSELWRKHEHEAFQPEIPISGERTKRPMQLRERANEKGRKGYRQLQALMRLAWSWLLIGRKEPQGTRVQRWGLASWCDFETIDWTSGLILTSPRDELSDRSGDMGDYCLHRLAFRDREIRVPQLLTVRSCQLSYVSTCLSGNTVPPLTRQR
ncbi:hypothetical protein AA313_de0207454 [Arthrobotrys entomopaga]|nr:hypothetical protein AA313_de0207454 [Arthrobotrys entomopaga]